MNPETVAVCGIFGMIFGGIAFWGFWKQEPSAAILGSALSALFIWMVL